MQDITGTLCFSVETMCRDMENPRRQRLGAGDLLREILPRYKQESGSRLQQVRLATVLVLPYAFQEIVHKKVR